MFDANGKGDRLSLGSALAVRDDGSIEMSFARNRLSRCFPLLTQAAINGITDIQAVVEAAFENYQAEYREKKHTEDFTALVQSQAVAATMMIWKQAIMESGMNRSNVGDVMVLNIWKQQGTPNELRVKMSYLAQLLEAGLPAGSQPDVEQWWKYFRQGCKHWR